jgi:hypothetical protein
MSDKIYQGKVPYHKGELLSYPDSWLMKDGEWRDNAPFTASMIVSGYGRGRSSAYFILKNEQGKSFPMFMTDMTDLIERTVIRCGVITGETWVVTKRGQNYGVKLHAISKEPR